MEVGWHICTFVAGITADVDRTVLHRVVASNNVRDGAAQESRPEVDITEPITNVGTKMNTLLTNYSKNQSFALD
ncbi:unnamed protein product [Strongylus vulgaris]|uniref:Uncharacterized protein n=1 Tax=Strongylus vulgaris TaxID=40348 RepID=A0A3P7L1N5_STRVU|nr:unnamed protein product [Strongylus vulgaris]